MAQLMPLPITVSCFSKIQTGFTSLVPAHPGSPGQKAVKRVCVCVEAARLITLHCGLSRVLMTTDQKPQALVVLKHLYNFLKRTTYDFIR